MPYFLVYAAPSCNMRTLIFNTSFQENNSDKKNNRQHSEINILCRFHSVKTLQLIIKLRSIHNILFCKFKYNTAAQRFHPLTNDHVERLFNPQIPMYNAHSDFKIAFEGNNTQTKY